MSAGLQEIRIASGLDFQKKFLKVFNALDPENYHLIESTQEFEIFDYYLFKKGEKEPYIVELKTRPNKLHTHFEDTLIDYLKLLKLRSLSHKSYVIICFEDTSLIINASLEPESVIVSVIDNMEKPVGLYEVAKLKKLGISLEALRFVK